MANPKAAESAAALRMLPSTDDLLTVASDHPTMLSVGRRTLTVLARSAIESVRKELVASISDQPGRTAIYSKESLLADASERLKALRSEEHTSELQSQSNLVCRLLLEKKKKKKIK